VPLPTDANVNLLICDAVRQKPDGKLDLAGFFPVPEIRVDPAAQLPGALNLTFVYVIKDGDGRFAGLFRIVDPLGKELHRQPLDEVYKPPGQHHLMMLAVERIPIVHAGNYTIILELDGQPYRRTIRIFQ
jgi:uncharacterized protein DUF6941